MTQIEQARAGRTTPEMEQVARDEHLDAKLVREEVARGRMVIPANRVHLEKGLHAVGIGVAARTKINANLGNSPLSSDAACELAKVHCAIRYGADTIMDLSTGEEIDAIRQRIIEAVSVPVGTVPIYQMCEQLDDIVDMQPQDFLDVVEHQARQGVDYMTVHCAVLREHLPLTEKRLTGIVSRGGSLVAKWMVAHKQQNPFFTHFDQLCEIMRAYDVTWSLGDGLRPGSVADASDEAQFAELKVMADLTPRLAAWLPGDDRRARPRADGPDRNQRPPANRVVPRSAVLRARTDRNRRGPRLRPYHQRDRRRDGRLVRRGHALLCDPQGAPRPAQHGRCPPRGHRLQDRRPRGGRRPPAPGAQQRDNALSKARFDFDWDEQFRLSLDPDTARRMHQQSLAEAGGEHRYCSMCGPKFCSMRTSGELRRLGTEPTG